MVSQYRADFGGEDLVIETGKLAPQAGGAVTVRWGDTVVLVTATASKEPRVGVDFFPLTVDLEERRYAVGKIPGGFFKREGRPSTESILICRKIDRPLRPLFPEGYHNDVQIVVTPLSSDQQHDIDMMSIVGASTALMISDVPFDTPVGAARVGYIDGQYVINPTVEQMATSALDLAMAGTQQAVLMIEVGAHELGEDVVLEALRRGHAAMQGAIALQKQMRREVGKAKTPGTRSLPDAQLGARVRAEAEAPLRALVERGPARTSRREEQDAILAQVSARLGPEADKSEVSLAFEDVFKSLMRRHILDTGIRVDGRDLRTIRPLSAEVGLLPRTHGSALFNRGETQVLNIVTLGTASDEQTIEWLTGEGKRRYMHHYNFPPYSTGEASVMRGPRRREIGHGALAERAIEPLLPDKTKFPYTIRSVSEAISSNDSTSMASTCSSSLALFDAGVPLRAPVAGIAMGLVTEGERFAVLTDIEGLEDHLGDMDFKIAGTAKGITAIQLDIKISGISWPIIEETLRRAREARLQILDVMNACLAAPRPELSPYAPRITTLQIPVSKIGALIGPGGKTIRSIIEETGVTIDVDDSGLVSVGSMDSEGAAKALRRISELTVEPEIGKIYTGKVVRVADFGAFVEILPGRDGLVHISQLADFRVNRVEDVVKEGDEVMVMVTDVDPQGKVRLSRQAVLEGWSIDEARARDQKPSGPRPPRRDGDRDGGRDFRRDNRR